MFFHSVVCQLNLMIHHKTPASKIKIKCIEKRSHKGEKAKVSRFLRDFAKHPSLRQLVRKEKKPSQIFYNTEKLSHTGWDATTTKTSRAAAFRARRTFFFSKKKELEESQENERMDVATMSRRRKSSCSSDLPKLAII
jgi:hypothetical protein